jgi:hypothetical protein
MSLQRLVINTGNLSADGFKSVCNLAPGQLPALENFVNYLSGMPDQYNGLLSFQVGAVQAVGSLTVATGGSVADQACTILNVTLTGKASSTANNQFSVSATAATQAQNMVNAINASTDLAGKVTAARNGAIVVITSLVPGLMGNGFQLAAGNLANVTLSAAFTGGLDGTAYALDLR